MDLSSMSLEQLVNLRTEVDHAIELKRKQAQDALVAEVREKARLLGLSADVLAALVSGSGGERKKRVVKPSDILYKDPSSGATWSGRGRKPGWLLQALDSGASLQQFRV